MSKVYNCIKKRILKGGNKCLYVWLCVCLQFYLVFATCNISKWNNGNSIIYNKLKKHVAIHVDRLLNVSYRSDVINIKTKASPIATRTKTQKKNKQTKSFSKCYFKNAAKYFCYCCCLHFYSISVVAIAFFSWACCLQCFSLACCWW